MGYNVIITLDLLIRLGLIMYGRFVFPNGDYYEGEYTQTPNGIVRNGEGRYMGAFKDILKHSESSHRSSEKTDHSEEDLNSTREPENFQNSHYVCYSGTWVNDKIDGYGFARYPNGEKYEGQFQDNK